MTYFDPGGAGRWPANRQAEPPAPPSRTEPRPQLRFGERGSGASNSRMRRIHRSRVTKHSVASDGRKPDRTGAGSARVPEKLHLAGGPASGRDGTSQADDSIVPAHDHDI